MSGKVQTRQQTPAGYALRPPTMEDLPAVLAVRNACEQLVAGQDAFTRETLVAEWKDPHWDLSRGGCLAETPEGEIVAWAEFYDRGAHALLDGVAGAVHPEHRGRGVGRALLDWVLDRSREEETLAGAGKEVVLRIGHDVRNEYTRGLLEERGFGVIRLFYSMEIAIDGAIESPEWPGGIVVRSMNRPEDDEPFFAVKRESFRDHWGMAEVPREEGLNRFRAWIDGDPHFEPELFRAACEGEEIAGVCFTLPAHDADATEGYVAILGVRRPWRRHGLARALLLDAFELCRQRGLRSVALGVDAAGETGAVDLYVKAGMKVTRRYELQGLVLRPGSNGTNGGSP